MADALFVSGDFSAVSATPRASLAKVAASGLGNGLHGFKRGAVVAPCTGWHQPVINAPIHGHVGQVNGLDGQLLGGVVGIAQAGGGAGVGLADDGGGTAPGHFDRPLAECLLALQAIHDEHPLQPVQGDLQRDGGAA